VFHAHRVQPRRVRIASHNLDLVEALIVRLLHPEVTIVVESPAIQHAVQERLGMSTDVVGAGAVPDVVIVPAFLHEDVQPLRAPAAVVACHNALSYRGLWRRDANMLPIFSYLLAFRAVYRLEAVTGLFSPLIMAVWAGVILLQRMHSPWYFWLEQVAMRRHITYGPLWRVCSIVIACGSNPK
jgi:hypothetical protein